MPDKDTTPPDHTDLSEDELTFEEQQRLTKILEDYRSNPIYSNKYRHDLFAEINDIMTAHQPPIVADKELDEILQNIYNIGRHEEAGGLTDRQGAFTVAKAALLQREQRLVAEAEQAARIDQMTLAESFYIDGVTVLGWTESSWLKKVNELEAQLRHNTNTGKDES